MLTLTIPAMEAYDDDKQEFITLKAQTLQLEHSLVSLAKWESKWCKPFLSRKNKTYAESVDYIRCMTVTQNVPPEVYRRLTPEQMEIVNAYIESPMTATTFHKKEQKTTGREVITAEVIYFWMISFNIPFECQKWHLNRLLTLVNVCGVRSQKQKPMKQKDLIARNRALNSARRQQLHTSG